MHTVIYDKNIVVFPILLRSRRSSTVNNKFCKCISQLIDCCVIIFNKHFKCSMAIAEIKLANPNFHECKWYWIRATYTVYFISSSYMRWLHCCLQNACTQYLCSCFQSLLRNQYKYHFINIIYKEIDYN